MNRVCDNTVESVPVSACDAAAGQESAVGQSSLYRFSVRGVFVLETLEGHRQVGLRHEITPVVQHLRHRLLDAKQAGDFFIARPWICNRVRPSATCALRQAWRALSDRRVQETHLLWLGVSGNCSVTPTTLEAPHTPARTDGRQTTIARLIASAVFKGALSPPLFFHITNTTSHSFHGFFQLPRIEEGSQWRVNHA